MKSGRLGKGRASTRLGLGGREGCAQLGTKPGHPLKEGNERVWRDHWQQGNRKVSALFELTSVSFGEYADTIISQVKQ